MAKIPVEDEYKLLWPTAPGTPARRLAAIRPLVEQAGLSLRVAGPPALQVDVYFDDEAGSLLAAGMSFRLRKTPGRRLITLKMGHTSPPHAHGRFQRQEAEAEVSPAEARTLLRGGEITAAPFFLLRQVAPSVGPLHPVARVTNRRQVAILENAARGQAELALDRVTYEVDGMRRGPEIEVEIENHRLGRQELRALGRRLEKELGRTPSRGSKYERAMR